MPTAPDSRSQRVLDTIYALFFHGLRWPLFVDLDRYLDRRDEPNADEVLVSLPPGLVRGVAPDQRHPVREDTEVGLTIAGMACCSQAQEDLQIFVSAIRHAVDLERVLEPGDPPAKLTSAAIAQAVPLPAAGRSDSIARLGVVLGVDAWGWTVGGSHEGTWEYTFDRRVRRFRGVTSVEDYWAAAHPEPIPARAPLSASFDEAPASGPPVTPSIFVSYAHADAPVAREIAGALRAYGARVWVDEGELRAGDSIIQRIAEAVSEVDFVVALVSEHSVNSNWCRKELALATSDAMSSGAVKVLPVRLGDTTMPDALRDVLYRQVDTSCPAAVAALLIDDVRAHGR